MSDLESLVGSQQESAIPKKSKFLDNFYDFSRKYIDYKMGAIGAFSMGFIVGCINISHGIVGATTASLKQAAYTFLLGGAVTRLCENLAKITHYKKVAYTASIIIPSMLTLSLTYLIHILKGTPEPLLSTVPTMLLAPPFFAYWGHKMQGYASQTQTSTINRANPH